HALADVARRPRRIADPAHVTARTPRGRVAAPLPRRQDNPLRPLAQRERSAVRASRRPAARSVALSPPQPRLLRTPGLVGDHDLVAGRQTAVSSQSRATSAV